ncbi:MAG: hypothetical protein EZS28_033966 [Streblomastix strix]|uniref:Uncharacterized protein n=1 Tax=Streblomastix strix TaxID=222440 RepID=A0A5J4UJ61_9EUKA|nr:MAG: hypothetical protein EZS28_033966 [Streblomastix strix]
MWSFFLGWVGRSGSGWLCWHRQEKLTIINTLYKSQMLQKFQNQNLLRSLIALTNFKLGTQFSKQIDKQRLEVRHWSREFLNWIRLHGDEQIQAEIVNVGYGKVICISFGIAEGIGEEQEEEIYLGLNNIYNFFEQLHEGSNYHTGECY